MITFDASIQVAADPDSVWSVLTETTRWTEWDSGVLAVDGRLALGNKIKITSRVNPGRAFPAKVTALEPPSNADPGRMVWTGGMPFGLFTGERTFTVDDLDTGSRFTMREVFRGPLLRLIARTLPDLQPSFDQFANGLKSEVERQHPSARQQGAQR